MKTKFKNFAPAIVLGVICLVVAALLATINYLTAPRIEENDRIARTASLTKAFGEGAEVQFDKPYASLPEGAAESVIEIYPELSGNGYAVTLEFQGYADKIGLTVGINKDGKVAGVVITKSNESHNKDAEMNAALNKLAGKAEGEIDGVTLVSGATKSSDYIKNAVKDAIAATKLAKEQGLTVSLTSGEGVIKPAPALTEAELMEKGNVFFPGNGGFKKELESYELHYTQKYHDRVKSIYAENGGKGYLVFLATVNEDRPHETETELVLALDAEFNIVGFEITRWTLSSNYKPEICLGSEAVNKLQESINGTNVTNLGTEVDLISGATQTSYRVYNLVTEALDYFTAEKVGEYVKEYATAKIEGAEGFELVEIPERRLKKGAKLIYKEKTGKGYAIYFQTATQYNYDETRFVCILDSAFNITDVDVWRWSTGVYEGATFPNSDAIKEKLAQSLVEANKTTLTDKADLILGATGTSGNVVAAVAEAIDFLDTNLEKYILTYANGVITDADGFTALDISGAALTSGIKRIYKENSGKGYVVYAVTKTQYNPMETEIVFVLNKNMRVVDLDIWFYSTGTYDGMTGSDSAKVDLLENSFDGVTRTNVDLKVDLISGATGTTNNVKAAVLEAINYLDPPIETNVWQIAAIAVFFASIVAIGVGIYFQRRRRV